jgi:hypothetical protein
LASRTSSASLPTASAISWITLSIAAIACGAPKPRNAVFGGRLVRQARPRIDTFGRK